MRGVFAQLPMQRLPAVSALRRLSSASGSDAGGGGILERASAAVGLGEASHTRAAAKMAEARERGVSWTEATSEAMRDVRKERRSESLREFYEGLAAAPTFDLGALRAQYEEGLAAEDKAEPHRRCPGRSLSRPQLLTATAPLTSALCHLHRWSDDGDAEDGAAL